MNQEIAQVTKIAIFRNRKIRKTIHKNEWWFVITDVIVALTDSQNPKQYLKNMLNRDDELAKGWVQIEHLLLIETPGGKQKVRCANTEGIFRIIQSIPSPKAEPFKRWLARVGYERIQEIEDPELAQKRARTLYKAKGYPQDWIERRMRSIAIREELTDEWKNHGVELAKEYEILTAEISKATFGVTPSEYKKIKGLKRQNLRDHMSDLELLFSQLGEAATTEITKTEHPKGFEKNKQVSRRGGKIAGDARSNLEKETGRKVITTQNYLPKRQSKKLLKK
ncbi:MAG: Prophage antirepressor [Candidatus Daviesbacteria bacterium GW2011_GWA2_38_24]|uniref:Prophage antirepressor n=1 Tax=Candidatus Daviesbacteria bacterium GW2011_GWA2_38_24 TaxID=1618422 RepID=A0A0G0M0F6_9BACT|nr:MAG: Prophage antirepressor [Candidatus Daviesbacteria bacterium GW2011_GWA2_38_24]OGE22790.1 MAG: phage antirepressor protein [Candidatus Daviesbacteria bacterium RIFCSPHIGHO2_01_FULL_38_8]